MSLFIMFLLNPNKSILFLSVIYSYLLVCIMSVTAHRSIYLCVGGGNIQRSPQYFAEQRAINFFRLPSCLHCVGPIVNQKLMAMFDVFPDNLWSRLCLVTKAAGIYRQNSWHSSAEILPAEAKMGSKATKSYDISDLWTGTVNTAGWADSNAGWSIETAFASIVFLPLSRIANLIRNLLSAIRVDLLMVSLVDAGLDLEWQWEGEREREKEREGWWWNWNGLTMRESMWKVSFRYYWVGTGGALLYCKWSNNDCHQMLPDMEEMKWNWNYLLSTHRFFSVIDFHRVDIQLKGQNGSTHFL